MQAKKDNRQKRDISLEEMMASMEKMLAGTRQMMADMAAFSNAGLQPSLYIKQVMAYSGSLISYSEEFISYSAGLIGSMDQPDAVK